MADQRRHVVIIGGGLAGMSAAEAIVRACPQRFRITLLEARRQTGGRAGSYHDSRSRASVDYCQHVAMGCCTNFLDLMQRCGLTDDFRRYTQLEFLHPDHPPSPFVPSRWLPPPLHLAGTIGALRYLSRSQKTQIRRGLWRLMRTRSSAVSNQTAANWLAATGQTPATIRDFWDVILVSALGEETSVVTMAAAKKVFIDGFAAARGASDVLVPAVPLSVLFGERLPKLIADQGVQVQTGDAVKRVLTQENKPTAVLSSQQQIRADHLIVAVPWHRIADLLAEPSTTAAITNLAAISHLPTSPITGLHLWFDRQITAKPHAVMVGTISQWLFRDPIDSKGDSDEHYYQVVISASHQARQIPKPELVDRVLAELRHALAGARNAHLLRHRIVTDPQSVFSLRPQVDDLRPAARTALPWLHLAGDWIATGWPATMEGAVISGRMAASSVLQQEGLEPVETKDGLPRGWLSRLLLKP